MTMRADIHRLVGMDDSLIKRIDLRLKSLGKSRSGASREAGLNHNAIGAIAEGRTRNPRIDTIRRLAEVLECTPEWLASGDGPTSRAPIGDGTLAGAPRLPSLQGMRRDIPVLGSATGGPDGALNIDGPIDYARRPETLANADGVYCINVSGESMEPEFRPGMTLYVSKKLPPGAGDAVVVQCAHNYGGQDTIEVAFIKILKRKPGGGTRFWQHNEEGEWTPPGKVLAIHRVFPWNELLPPY